MARPKKIKNILTHLKAVEYCNRGDVKLEALRRTAAEDIRTVMGGRSVADLPPAEKDKLLESVIKYLGITW